MCSAVRALLQTEAIQKIADSKIERVGIGRVHSHQRVGKTAAVFGRNAIVPARAAIRALEQEHIRKKTAVDAMRADVERARVRKVDQHRAYGGRRYSGKRWNR